MNIVHHIQKVRIKIILYYLCLISTIFSQSLPAKAQITPDNSLGAEASQLNQNVLIHDALGDKINGGAKRDSNVFHSFSEFNIQDGQRVYFANPTGVENILARVTGGKASNIFGTLGVDGVANLFLINPNGILFGENARLDVQGSFVGTTANGVQFGNQGNFSATNPQAPALLTVNPSALFFNQINQGAGIQNNSIAAAGIDSAGFKTFGLRVPDGKSLLLVGGNVSMNGGWLNADGGRVELGGLTASGNINLVSNGDNLSLKFPENVTRADVSLTNKAFVHVQGAGGGNIAIDARNIEILDGSGLNAGIGMGLGETETIAGNITLNGTGEIKITGSGSQIVNLVRPEAKGNGGNITIDSGSFSLQDGAMLSTSTYGQGNAGNVILNAKNGVSIADADIFSTVEAGGVGKGGNININATTLSLTDGAQLQTSTSGAFHTQPAGRGDAGNVNINVTGTVDIAGNKNGSFSVINSIMGVGTVGNGGNITIDSGNLSLRDRAVISASTLGQGNAGNVTLNANNAITLADAAIFSTVSVGGVGKGGNININAATLSLTDGAQLQTATSSAFDTQPAGRGDAGNVNIKVTGTIDIAGNNKNGFFSSISSLMDVGTVGNGGNITIDSGNLSLRDGAILSAATYGQGNAGNIYIYAKNALTVSGTSQETGFSSGLFTFSDSNSIGKGGNITLNTNIFHISNGALLDARTRNNQEGGNITVNAKIFEALNGGQLTTTASNNGRAGKITVNADDKIIISGSDLDFDNRVRNFPGKVVNIGANSGLFVSSTGLGITGDIEVNSPQITLDNQGKLNAESASSNGGNITVNSNLLLLRHGAQISTSATTEKLDGNGGNININSRFIFAVPNENSNISANALRGKGGNIKINSQGIFGIESRTKPTKKSDITTSSELGVSGVTNINVPENSFIPNSFTGLSQNAIDTNALIANSCISRGIKQQENSFTITGSGALPTNRPGVWVSSYRTGEVRGVEITSHAWKKGDPIIEPQGLYRLSNGQLILSRSC